MYKMPPKKDKSTDSLINELENLRMNSETKDAMSSYPSISSMSSDMSSRRSTPANDLMNSITDEEMSEVSNVAVVPFKRIKPKKAERKSAKKGRKQNKTKRGGRTPKEVYYKYSPNTGKRIRMTTKKKN